jgi:hypothetical protein
MAETSNIAKMADKLSTELFNDFNWERVGEANTNWECVDERHAEETHPSDVVFYYDNPYSLSRTYINCDLKSYAVSSITRNAIAIAATRLARSLSCAEKSADWQNKYLHQNVSPEICALLFVYNHDGDYDSDFQRLVSAVDYQRLEVPPGSKLFVLGPKDIFWLNNVRYDIVYMRGNGELPPKPRCAFHYPHLGRKKNVQPEKAKAATLDMLTGPWITMEYQPPTGPMRRGFLIYYRPRGEHIEEFLYLIDHILHYQILTEDTEVHIKTIDPDPNSHSRFRRAIDQYVHEHSAGAELKNMLDRITFSEISNLRLKFSEQQIGMENA